MKQLSGIRKAFASLGDDTTLTRFVKLESRHQKRHKTGLMPADAERTRFLNRVIPVSQMPSVLVTGHSNVKIGRDVRKGPLRGYWIYTLSLEERRTCPRTCKHWRDCFGNAMPFAKRVQYGRELEIALAREIPRLLAVRGRRGILVRLHALGDFYDTFYVKLWEQLLEQNPRLAVFGYTARLPGTVIGDEVARVKERFGMRFAIRYSDGGRSEDCTVSIKDQSQCPSGAFICPEQTAKTAACATCGLCWGTKRNVAFLEH